MEYSTCEINNIKVKKLKLDNDDKKIKPKQFDMFGRAPFPNIYICSMKGGGKTNLIAFIIKQIITSKTKVRIFSTTAHNDMTMKKLLEKLDKYEFSYEIFESPYDGKKDLIEDQYIEIEKEVQQKEQEINKSEWYYPLYIYVYDDMTDLLKFSKGFDRMLC